MAIVIAGMLHPPTRTKLREAYYGLVRGTPIVASIPRKVLDCRRLAGPKTLVALTFGQSNSANFVRGRYRAKDAVFYVAEGRCFTAEDPLPGADGDGGSVWSRLGDLLIASGRYERVVFAGIGVANSTVSSWSPGGDLHPKLMATLKGLVGTGLTPTHLLWHQGEADRSRHTTGAAYQAHFRDLVQAIRQAKVAAPILVAVASYCYGDSSAQITSAQAALVSRRLNIYAGPNTDNYTAPAERADDCHFSALGAERVAAAWFAALSAVRHE
ncbi:MAG: hypothetical protein HYX63_00815 [Gammaproteobacteria bacterium]|nr:hypothetical protein [Gammaproteobacteria bacterium]